MVDANAHKKNDCDFPSGVIKIKVDNDRHNQICATWIRGRP